MRVLLEEEQVGLSDKGLHDRVDVLFRNGSSLPVEQTVARVRDELAESGGVTVRQRDGGVPFEGVHCVDVAGVRQDLVGVLRVQGLLQGAH